MKLLTTTEVALESWFSLLDDSDKVEFAISEISQRAALCVEPGQLAIFYKARISSPSSDRLGHQIDSLLSSTQVALCERSSMNPEITIKDDTSGRSPAVACARNLKNMALPDGLAETPHNGQDRDDFFHRSIGKFIPFARHITIFDSYLPSNILDKSESASYLIRQCLASNAVLEIHGTNPERGPTDSYFAEKIGLRIHEWSSGLNEIIVVLYRPKNIRTGQDFPSWVRDEDRNITKIGHERFVQMTFDRGKPLTISLGQGSDTFAVQEVGNKKGTLLGNSSVYGPMPNNSIEAIFPGDVRDRLRVGAAHVSPGRVVSGIKKNELMRFAARHAGLIQYP